MNADSDPDWEQSLAAVQVFVTARGTARIPPGAMAAGVAVGAWVLQQRKRYWGAQLTHEQIRRLEALPGWSWAGPAEKKWQRALRALTDYAERNGTTAIPAATVVSDIRLGEWVAAQRAGRQTGRLPAANAAALEAVPSWRWRIEDIRWEQGVAALRAYIDEHGTSDAPPDAVIGGFRLGSWLRSCRAEYDEASLPHERIAVLESFPGWRWSLFTRRWEQGLAALRAYVATHGSASPPQNARFGGFPVGRWVHARRRQHASGALSRARCAELEALPGWHWTARSDS